MTMPGSGKRGVWVAAVLAAWATTACLVACGNARRNPGGEAEGGGDGITAGTGATGGVAGSERGCADSVVTVPKRLVRLSFGQTTNAVGALTDTTAAQRLVDEFEIVDSQHRTFPPLANPREGESFTDSNWSTADQMAEEIGGYVVDNLAAVTGCGDDPTEKCVTDFVMTFAERAYRRPLRDDEQDSLLRVVAGVVAMGDTPTEALRCGVQAVLEAPQFLYRTEFGEDARAAGRLTAYELADQLAFFLTDAPPDALLRAAASDEKLASREQISTQIARLLATPAARKNLEGALFSYLGLPGVESVIIDDPGFTGDVRTSMWHEAEQFLDQTLWSGPVSGLLTSGRSSVDATLASIYGIGAFPPLGAKTDARGFALIDLPGSRAGFLTMPGFLTARSRPDAVSVVGRGLMVNALLCVPSAPFPGEAVAQSPPPSLAGATARAQAEYRAVTKPCSDCHPLSDPYGLALDNFDRIGRFRTLDDEGRSIDPAVVLPAVVGGRKVSSAVEMGRALADSGRFQACLTRNFMDFALAGVASIGLSLDLDSCSVRDINEHLQAAEPTFADMVTQIALSDALTERAAPLEAP